MNEDMLRPAGSRLVPNSRLTCAQCERMILDAIDGTLLPEDQAQFDLHIAGCPACSRVMEEAQKGEAWLSVLKAAPPEPSSELLERILAHTSGDPAVAIPVMRPDTILGGNRQPFSQGHLAPVLPFRATSPRAWLTRITQAVVQPRFAMTAAMAFFSIALTMNLAGIQLRDLHASSLKPANVRHGFWAMNSRVVRYYDRLRIVYELESRVREMQKLEEDHPVVEERPLPATEVPPSTTVKPPDRGKSPRSSNSIRNKSHQQAVSGQASKPTILALQYGSSAVSVTGKGGEGVRA